LAKNVTDLIARKLRIASKLAVGEQVHEVIVQRAIDVDGVHLEDRHGCARLPGMEWLLTAIVADDAVYLSLSTP